MTPGGEEAGRGRQNHHETRRQRRSTQVRDVHAAHQKEPSVALTLRALDVLFGVREPVMLFNSHTPGNSVTAIPCA